MSKSQDIIMLKIVYFIETFGIQLSKKKNTS